MANLDGLNGTDNIKKEKDSAVAETNTEDVADDGDEEAVNINQEDQLENGDDEKSDDENEEDDDKTKAKKPRYFIPSRLEFRQDRIREQQERTVMIGPTTLEDLNYPKLMQCIRGSTQFFIRFFKDDQKAGGANGEDVTLKAENGGTVTVKTENCADDDFRGHIEIRFNSIPEAEKCVATLQSFREGLTAKRITYEYTKDDEYKEMRKIGNPQDSDGLSGHRASRMVTIPGITAEVTREMITEKVPDAIEVMIPKATTGDVIKGYAYVELQNAQKAKELENKSLELGEKFHKCYTLLEIPALDSVIRRIDKERVAEAPSKPMEQSKKDRLRLLLRYASHYERVEDLPEPKLEAIKKRIQQIRKRLRTESRRAATVARGGRGKQNGARGRGASRGSRGTGSFNANRGGFNMRGRGGFGPVGYGQRPMSAGYPGAYDFNGYQSYPGGYEEYGDFSRMNMGYGPGRGAMQNGMRSQSNFYRGGNNARGGW